MGMKQEPPTEVKTSLQNCGFSVQNFLYAALLVPRI
jgi:hypothetical protein